MGRPRKVSPPPRVVKGVLPCARRSLANPLSWPMPSTTTFPAPKVPSRSLSVASWLSTISASNLWYTSRLCAIRNAPDSSGDAERLGTTMISGAVEVRIFAMRPVRGPSANDDGAWGCKRWHLIPADILTSQGLTYRPYAVFLGQAQRELGLVPGRFVQLENLTVYANLGITHIVRQRADGDGECLHIRSVDVDFAWSGRHGEPAESSGNHKAVDGPSMQGSRIAWNCNSQSKGL